MDDLPPFPVDPETLDLLEASLDAGSLWGTLDLLSGYDETQVRPLADDVVEYVGGPLYHPDDVLRALMAEVRRLRVIDRQPHAA